MARNQKLMANLEQELQDERAKHEEKIEIVEKVAEKNVAEAEIQTDPMLEVLEPLLEPNQIAEVLEKSVERKTSKNKKSMKSAKHSKSMDEPVAVLESPQAISKNTSQSIDFEEDDELMNHPKVLYEDELIVFKEQCATLQSENVRLSREMADMSESVEQVRQKALQQFVIKLCTRNVRSEVNRTNVTYSRFFS